MIGFFLWLASDLHEIKKELKEIRKKLDSK